MADSQRAELIALLKELCCEDAQAEQIAEQLSAGDKETARLLLRRHRRKLMEALHESEKRVDQLDFLIYRIEKDKA